MLPLVRFTPDSLPYWVPRFLRRQCDRTAGERSVKQCVVDGYNDEGCSGAGGKARAICALIEARVG